MEGNRKLAKSHDFCGAVTDSLYKGNEQSLEPTSFEPTSYNPTIFDPTSFDPASFDPTSFLATEQVILILICFATIPS